jgi:hypothetical protein
MTHLDELAKEVDLIDIRTTGMVARLASGPAPELGQAMDASIRIKAGVVREGETGFIVTLAVDCRPRRSKKDREFGRFVYRGIARYHAQKAWPQEVLDEFMRSNAMNHLWPYARNYVQISSAQLGLVPILLPPFRVSPRPPPIQEAP